MRTVTRFEGHLLKMLYALLAREPLGTLLPLLSVKQTRPDGLSRPCVQLMQAALAQGTVLWLARAGGWQRGRFLRGEAVSEGRLWERSSPADLSLSFSRHTVEFLFWLSTLEAADSAPLPIVPENELTHGDRVLLLLAYDSLRHVPRLRALLTASRQVGRHALLRLAFPLDFAASKTPARIPHWVPWLSGTGALVFEAVQPWLGTRRIETENGRRRSQTLATLRTLDRADEIVLSGFQHAAEAAGRRDLARWILMAAGPLSPQWQEPTEWIAHLPLSKLTLEGRLGAYRTTTTFLRQLLRLREWDQAARLIGYLDEGYAAAQLWKTDWERFQGEALCGVAERLIQHFDPLRFGGARDEPLPAISE